MFMIKGSMYVSGWVVSEEKAFLCEVSGSLRSGVLWW